MRICGLVIYLFEAEKLYPPGKCFWINSPASEHTPEPPLASSSTSPVTSLFQLHEVDDVEIAFAEVMFSSTMFTDHSPVILCLFQHHYEGSIGLLDGAINGTGISQAA